MTWASDDIIFIWVHFDMKIELHSIDLFRKKDISLFIQLATSPFPPPTSEMFNSELLFTFIMDFHWNSLFVSYSVKVHQVPLICWDFLVFHLLVDLLLNFSDFLYPVSPDWLGMILMITIGLSSFIIYWIIVIILGQLSS